MTATLDGLLAALRGVPDLPGAACKGHAALFDPARDRESAAEVEHRHRVALDTCETSCPALTRCRQWIDNTPRRDRPHGVVAGLVVGEPSTNKRKMEIA